MHYREALIEFERQYWQGLVDVHGSSAVAIAKAAQVNRTTVYSRLHSLGIPYTYRKYNRGIWGMFTH